MKLWKKANTCLNFQRELNVQTRIHSLVRKPIGLIFVEKKNIFREYTRNFRE